MKYFAEIVAAIESFPYGGIQVKVIRTRLRQILRGVLLPVALVASLRVWLYKRRSRLLGLILLSITAFTRVGASKVDHDAHGIVVEEHHAEHWAALSGAEPGHFPGKPIIISSLWETIANVNRLTRISLNIFYSDYRLARNALNSSAEVCQPRIFRG